MLSTYTESEKLSVWCDELVGKATESISGPDVGEGIEISYETRDRVE